MKVIFIKDLKKQGKKDEIKEVSDGYAMNYLIKNGYAIPANQENISQLKCNINRENKKEEKIITECEGIKKIIEKEKYEIKVKTGEHDKVFGKISTKQIVVLLSQHKINKTQVKLENDIACLGNHIVKIELHKKVIANINIKLIKE